MSGALVHTVAVRRRHLLFVALAGLLAGAGGACSETDGRVLPPADPQRTTTTSSTPSIEPPTAGVDAFTLRSSSFTEGGVIPEHLTCSGSAMSPGLSWTGTPTDATSLALVVRDRNAAGFVHWVVTDIDPFVQGIGEGGLPENAVEGRNDAGQIGWLAPCPPAGSGTHTYEVALFALPGVVDVPADASGEEAATILEASASERAVLTGTVTAGS
jgi:Raf kinase inhibitor-like YbhB/YbcL family protein